MRVPMCMWCVCVVGGGANRCVMCMHVFVCAHACMTARVDFCVLCMHADCVGCVLRNVVVMCLNC